MENLGNAKFNSLEERVNTVEKTGRQGVLNLRDEVEKLLAQNPDDEKLNDYLSRLDTILDKQSDKTDPNLDKGDSL